MIGRYVVLSYIWRLVVSTALMRVDTIHIIHINVRIKIIINSSGILPEIENPSRYFLGLVYNT